MSARLEYWKLLKLRKYWSFPVGKYVINKIEHRLIWGLQATRLKLGTQKRSSALSLDNHIIATKPANVVITTPVGQAHRRTILNRKYWKRVSIHNGYLFWRNWK